MHTLIADDEQTNKFWEQFLESDGNIVVGGELYTEENTPWADWRYVSVNGQPEQYVRLRCQGTVPEEIAHLLPNNAEFR